MRIPISEEQKGIALKFQGMDTYYFVTDYEKRPYHEGREMTFREFKELYPFQKSYGGVRCRGETKK